MKAVNKLTKKRARKKENGQAAMFLLLVLGLFLLGGIGLAVDMANVWMHRQAAQNAADAACTAAATDMVEDAGGATKSGGFTPGTAFKCSGNSSFSPCKYASFNGYSASGLTAGSSSTEVNVDFPGSVPGVPACSGTSAAICVASVGSLSTNFVRVTVTDRIQSFFVGLLSGKHTMDVGASASCGAVLSAAPIPILVLDPTDPNTLSLGGTGSVPKITIYGGPQRSIQVDSSNASAINANGNPVVNLSQGGPNTNGSDIGVTGGPAAPNFVFQGSPPGQYLDPRPRIADPFATLPVPKKPSAAPAVGSVTPANDAGCPAGTGSCDFYQAGYYSSGIQIKNKTAVFAPGLYYLDGNLTADANSCLRPSVSNGDGSGGTMFYFNSGTVGIVKDAGSKCSAAISTTAGTGTGQLQFGVKCTSKSDIPANLPANITGNLLMAPCTGDYGDPLLLDDPIGEQHGILMFANRSNNMAANGQPAFGGGGASAALGSLYFHYCNSTLGSGLGGGCQNPPNGYTDNLTMQGNSGSTSYVVGDIVTDQLTMGGTPQVVMDLNPNALFFVLKADLLQ